MNMHQTPLSGLRSQTVSTTERRGLDFARQAIALGLGSIIPDEARKIAEKRWGSNSEPLRILTKASVPGVATLSGSYGNPLVSSEGGAGEFFRLVVEQSVLGRMQGIRRIPFHVATLSQYSGATGSWVAEGAPIPMSSFAAERFTGLDTNKCCAMSVATRELLRELEAEEFIRADLVRACVHAIDQAFLDPTNAGTPDVKPASILNGVTETGDNSSPSSIDTYGDTFREAIAEFGGDLASAYWVVHPTVAGLLHSADHQQVGPRGGSYYGIPVITTRNAASDTVALIDASSIALATGGIEIEASEKGSIEMQDSPTNNSVVPTQTQHVSMFQSGSVAFKVTMNANWRLTRPNGAAWFNGYNAPGGSIIDLHQ